MVLGDKGALTSCYLDETEITRFPPSHYPTQRKRASNLRPAGWPLATGLPLIASMILAEYSHRYRRAIWYYNAPTCM